MADSKSEFSTIIGPDAKFKGELEFESAAKVLGRVEGSIASKGRIHIADGSECKATVSAKEVSVEGKVDGNVEAGDLIELCPNGVVVGDIHAARMTMAEGASINGHCRIGPNGGGSGNGTAKPASAAESKPQADAKATAAKASTRR